MKNLNISHSQDQWTIMENHFNESYSGKCEVIMALGNGNIGIRSATEENYYNEKRNTFIAGSFNRAYENEVTELPNIPDVTQIRLGINNRVFNLNEGIIHNYSRSLNLRTGELRREILWETLETGKVAILFRRIVSMDNRHLVAQSVEIRPLEKKLNLTVVSGIDGQLTNSGVQHFIEGNKRLFDQEVMTMVQKTSESNIQIVIASVHKTYLNNDIVDNDLQIQMDRRRIFGSLTTVIPLGSTYTLNKYSMLSMNRDLEFENMSLDDHLMKMVNDVKGIKYFMFDELLEKSQKIWEEIVWSRIPIVIESKESFDQVAIRFAQYHLQIMTPSHDKRMGIGAKGLTGEGYKGHSFWDTEVFIFPYFLYTQPEIARQLLEYRYLTLSGARQKAINNGYEGAMFPWESAWADDGEVTPIWGAADIVTGESTKIWSGFIEQHISADIVFAIFQYYSVTGDDAFMEAYGYEMIFDTAIFWSSRLEEGQDGWLHINEVIGPDEYKEHIDDNAFTNHLVHMNLELAVYYVDRLKAQKSVHYKRLNQQFDFDKAIIDWEKKMGTMYLPSPNEQQIIPQDSSYLTKKIIDLTNYKNQSHVGSIFMDYNLDQVNDIQVSKQADIMMLFYLREDLFSSDVKKINWDYYEPKTLHDSSLSLSTHSIIANDLGDRQLAYDLFTRCREIDLGQNMKTSDHGIHAAALGGMTQAIINGFGGVRVLKGELRIEPSLPEQWTKLSFVLNWHGDVLAITVTKGKIVVENTTRQNDIVEFKAFGVHYVMSEKTTIQVK